MFFWRRIGLFKKHFTFVIIPPKTSKVRRIKVPHVFLYGAVVIFLAFLVGGSLSFYHTLQIRRELLAYQKLKYDYLPQQISIKKVSNQVNKFKDEFDRLRELDFKLRLITDLEMKRPAPSMFGIGGFNDSTDRSLAEELTTNGLDLLGLLSKDLERLEKMARFQEESFNNLKSHLADKKDLIDRTPYRWPTRGFLTSTYGLRTHPLTGQQQMHAAIDIAALKGTPIRAPGDGIVTFAGENPSLGNMIVIDHGYGIITRYGHNNANLVRAGQKVKRGDVIATVGSTGRSTGPHLHYEIRFNDVAVNPLSIIID